MSFGRQLGVQKELRGRLGVEYRTDRVDLVSQTVTHELY